MSELEILQAHRPDAPPPDAAARQRASEVLATAVRGEQPSPRRWVARWVPAVGLVAAIAVALVVGVGSPPPDPSPTGTDTAPWLLHPQPAGALTQVRPGDEGMVEVRFLHPDADPERIRDELAEHGIVADVFFVPSDPFTVGTMVGQETPAGEAPIETLTEGEDPSGSGHPVGIRVPQGWTGEGYRIGIGRAALPWETFNSTVVLNAVRPGGPLHCADIRGMRPEEAAAVVEERGYRVVWRTQVRSLWGMNTVKKQPPADYWIWNTIWHSEDEIMLFADARRPDPPPPVVAELVNRGCDEAGR